MEIQTQRLATRPMGGLHGGLWVAISRCSRAAPWHIIPADRNWARNAAIARIVRETLEEMNPQYPLPKDWDPKAVKIV